MKNVKMMIVLSGLMIGAALQADTCSGVGVTIYNKAFVPGVAYTLYVNMGDKPSKDEKGLVMSGYHELKPDKSVCFKKGFKKNGTLFVREAHAKGSPKNQAYKFDVSEASISGGITEIKSIDIIAGSAGFELNVYGHGQDKSIGAYGWNIKHKDMVDVK